MERKFNSKLKLGEGVLFIRRRKYQCFQIPYSFVILVINHHSNTCGTIRHLKDSNKYLNVELLPNKIIKILEKIHD